MKLKWFSISFLLLIVLLAGVYLFLDPEKNVLDESSRANLGGTYISLSEGVTHYQFDGPENGPLVVLVHGGTVPAWGWDGQIKALREAGFRVLSYDKYGRGYSDRPKTKYDQKLYQEQLFELINALGITQPFDLIGVSLGGASAINFTAAYPEHVRKLILISPVINNFKVSGMFRVPIVGDFIARIAGVNVIIDRFKSLYGNYPGLDTYVDLFREQTTYKGFQRSLLSMLRSDALGDYSPAYRIVGKQQRDVLLIWGMEDTEITEAMIENIKACIPNIEAEPVDSVGHGILIQKMDTVNNFIIRFLQTN